MPAGAINRNGGVVVVAQGRGVWQVAPDAAQSAVALREGAGDQPARLPKPQSSVPPLEASGGGPAGLALKGSGGTV